MFDLLGSGKKISDKQKADLKDVAKHLLNGLKEKEFKVSLWVEKVQTAAAAKRTIKDCLFKTLPYPEYDETDISQKTEVMFDFFRVRYYDFGSASAA